MYFNCIEYQSDVREAVDNIIGAKALFGKKILLTGASGQIGSFLLDMLILLNETKNADISIYVVCRNIEMVRNRYTKDVSIVYIQHDMNDEICFNFSVDYIIHAAGNSYPQIFDVDPIGTIMGIVNGTKNFLEYAVKRHVKKFLYISSGEIYGQYGTKIDAYKEEDLGYIDCLNPRSCYPYGKRTAETLCASYKKQYNLDVVIARPCHIYGPNMTQYDNRASSQFFKKAMKRENIVLKSKGEQVRSYCYVADCGSALMTILINGKNGQAYNVSNRYSKVSIAQFAEIVAKQCGRCIEYQITNCEKPFIHNQILDCEKLEELGWKGMYDVQKGIYHTILIIQNK